MPAHIECDESDRAVSALRGASTETIFLQIHREASSVIKTILVSIETGLLKMTEWQGWEPADRRMIQDMYRQVKHLQRRHEQRAVLMKRGGR